MDSFFSADTHNVHFVNPCPTCSSKVALLRQTEHLNGAQTRSTTNFNLVSKTIKPLGGLKKRGIKIKHFRRNILISTHTTSHPQESCNGEEKYKFLSPKIELILHQTM